jgi:hypothetical protein
LEPSGALYMSSPLNCYFALKQQRHHRRRF